MLAYRALPGWLVKERQQATAEADFSKPVVETNRIYNRRTTILPHLLHNTHCEDGLR